MSNLTELAMDLRMKGTSVDEVAKRLKVSSESVSRVNAGAARNEKIEIELIRLGCGYLLKKIQTKTGIFKPERYDRLVEEARKE